MYARAAVLGPHDVRGNHGIVLNNNGVACGFVDARSRQVYFASADGFAGVRSCETAFCGAWPFGRRLVALGFALGFSAALPFPHACNSIFVCIELIEEKESHVATSVYPSHHVCVPREHLTVRTNGLVNEQNTYRDIAVYDFFTTLSLDATLLQWENDTYIPIHSTSS